MSTSFIEQVHYNRIPVKDLKLSAHWYRDILGLPLLSLNKELAILKINDGPSLLILVPTPDDTYAHFNVNGTQAFSIAFTSRDIPGFHQHLTDHKVKVDDIQHDDDHAYFHFHDPNGNKFQVHW